MHSGSRSGHKKILLMVLLIITVQVKKEFVDLYVRYAPLWQKEESERKQRWSALLNIFIDDSLPQSLIRSG
jgi:hypothetical protein